MSMRFARIIAATACAFALLPPVLSQAATRDVEIPGRYFQPPRVTINAGNTVRWTNASGDRHSIKSSSRSSESFASSDSCPGGILFSDCLRSGESYAHTFPRAGTYDYFCQIHGNDNPYPSCGMCGRVTVRKQSGGTIAPTTPGTASPTTTSSASATPTISGSPAASPGASTAVAAPDENDTSSTTLVAIAVLAVALLGGTGVIVYRTMIRR